MINGFSRDPRTNTLVVALGVTPQDVAGMLSGETFTVLETDLRQMPEMGTVEHVRLHVFTGKDDAELLERLEQLALHEETNGQGCGRCENCRANAAEQAERVVEEAEQVARQAAEANGD